MTKEEAKAKLKKAESDLRMANVVLEMHEQGVQEIKDEIAKLEVIINKPDREKARRDMQLKKMEKLSKEDMGRVILYRGKKEVSKEWIYGFLTVKPSYGNTQAYYIEYVEELYKDGKFNGLKHHSHRVIPETVGQLVKEYNSVRYFEGDIGRTKDEGKLIIILTWIDQHSLFGWLTPEEYEQNKSGNLDFDTILFWTYAFSDDSAKDIEVIGNIHDNPELVRKQKKYKTKL